MKYRKAFSEVKEELNIQIGSAHYTRKIDTEYLTLRQTDLVIKL